MDHSFVRNHAVLDKTTGDYIIIRKDDGAHHDFEVFIYSVDRAVVDKMVERLNKRRDS